MFTVFIAEKHHIDAIQQENKLFFEPFLGNKDLTFCCWNPQGQTLEESVPGLFDAVGRRKTWRAVIINNSTDETRKTQNPFDIVDSSVVAALHRPADQPPTANLPPEIDAASEDAEAMGAKTEALRKEWITEWENYFRELAPLKDKVYRDALQLPLQKLSTWLCFRPSPFVLDEVSEKKDEHDWAIEVLDGGHVKIGTQRELLERDNYRHELQVKESLRREFLGDWKLNIAYPTEICCISERIPDVGYFHPDTFWTLRPESDYSAFADRNMLFDRMRFMVFDMLPETHRDYRCEKIRFLFTTLVLASNEIPGSAMQPRKLYQLESENDDTPLCTIATSYDRKLVATFETIGNEMEHIRSTIPGELTDREASRMFCTPTDVSVPLDKTCSPEKLQAKNRFGLASDCPEDEYSAWDTSSQESQKELRYIVKQQSRSVKKSVDKLQLMSEISNGNISRLTSFQIDDVRDCTESAEDEMVKSIPPELGTMSRYAERVEKSDAEVRKVIDRRMRRKTTVALGAICLVLFLLCCLPMLLTNRFMPGAITVSAIMIAVMVGLIGLVLFITLFFLRRPLKKAVKAFNNNMSDILNDITASMQRFSKYLSAVCNTRRGFAILNYSEENLDEYTKSIRIRKKHQEDIRKMRALLAERYGDFIGDDSMADATLTQPYEYNFGLRAEYAYPAPFVAGDCRQIEFLESGNLVTVPSSYVTRISVRLEEIYDK